MSMLSATAGEQFDPGAIAGGVIGAVIVLAIAAIVAVVLIKRHGKHQVPQVTSKDLYSVPHTQRPAGYAERVSYAYSTQTWQRPPGNSRQFLKAHLPPVGNTLMLSPGRPGASTGALVAGFTLDQLRKALSDNVTAVNRFVASSLKSTESNGEQ